MTDNEDAFEVRQDNRFGIVPRDVAYSKVSAVAKAVYLVLAQFSQAYPSRKFIADRLGMSLSTVKRGIKELVDAGFVQVEHRFDDNGAQRSSLYHLGTMSYSPPQVVEGGSQVDPPQVHPRTPPRVTDEPGPGSPVTPIKKQRERNNGEVLIYAGQKSSFEDFWAVYPRRAAKAEAQKAWAKATQTASPEVILDGARRYRDDPNREPKYTPHPSTWLNQGRWDDDPLPSLIPRAVSKVDQNLTEYVNTYGGMNEHRGSLPALDPGVGQGWENSFGEVGRSMGG